MASYQQYQLTSGKKAWKFQAYGPKDPQTGQRHKVTRQGFATKAEAKLAAARFETQARDNGFIDLKDPTFREVYQQFFAQYKLSVKESTWARTEELFDRRILPLLGNKKIKEVTANDVQAFVNKLFESGYAKYELAWYFVQRVFTYAQNLRLRFDNPAENTIIPSKPEPKEPHQMVYYNESELRAFFAVLDKEGSPQAKAFYRLVAFSGIRKGEALGLTWEDIDLDNGTLSIVRTQYRGKKNALKLSNSPKTVSSARHLYLDPKTVQVLSDWRDNQINYFRSGVELKESKQLVFPNQKNKLLRPAAPWDWLREILNNHPELSNITVHGFRHTYATLAYGMRDENGDRIDIKAIQAQLGHKSYQTTVDMYISADGDRLSDMSKTFAKNLNF